MPSQMLTAFFGDRCIACGTARDVVRRAKALPTPGPNARIAVHDDVTGRAVDVSLRGTAEEMKARLLARLGIEEEAEQKPRGRGRPKLGVVSREVTLLPRHWEWLAAQPGSASVALRRLVDEARLTHAARDRYRLAQQAAYAFISAMASHRPNFEEATRALYAGDARRFHELVAPWPTDIKQHAERLARLAFDNPPAEP